MLAFTLPQTRNPGIGYLVWTFLRDAGWSSPEGRLIREGVRRGRRADWLIDQDWESLLPRPLEDVRELLGIDPPPIYEKLRSAGAPILD